MECAELRSELEALRLVGGRLLCDFFPSVGKPKPTTPLGKDATTLLPTGVREERVDAPRLIFLGGPGHVDMRVSSGFF